MPGGKLISAPDIPRCCFCGCFADVLVTREADGKQVPLCCECVSETKLPWERGKREPARGGLGTRAGG